MSKYVYLFKEGNAQMRNLLGGKGANLAEMTSIGLPVPQGFTVTTEACSKYYDDGRELSEEVIEQIFTALKEVEKQQNKKFGDSKNPLLVSVRSGARASMPGMMDTVLNLGLTASPKINIYGSVYSTIICFAVICILHIISIIWNIGNISDLFNNRLKKIDNI